MEMAKIKSPKADRHRGNLGNMSSRRDSYNGKGIIKGKPLGFPLNYGVIMLGGDTAPP